MNITITPTKKQYMVWKKLFDDHTRYILFGGGAGGGKSWLICEWITYMCLKYPGTKWFIGREELKRLMGSTFITLLKVFQKHGIPKEMWVLNGAYNYVKFSNGSRIDLLDVKNLPSDPLYERFGSMEFTGGALEEVGEIHFSAFDVLKSRIGRHMNKDYNLPSKILLTCNPKKNWVYYEFYKPHKEGTLTPDKCFIQALYWENPYTASEYEQNLSSIRDLVMRQRLKDGLWEYDDDPSKLFEYDSIINMFSNKYVQQPNEKKYLSVDVARLGSDNITIFVWKGWFIEKIHVFNKQRTTVTEDKINEIALAEGIPRSQIVVDEDGVGGGVVDHLPGIKGFVNNSKPFIAQIDKMQERPVLNGIKTYNYGNLKAQCYDALAIKVNNNEIGIYGSIPEDWKDKLIIDLEQIRRVDPDKDGKFYVTPKEEIKEQIGRSPDFGDAMMMRMIFDIKKTAAFAF